MGIATVRQVSAGSAAVIVAVCSAIALGNDGTGWMETFDSDVGRFDITTGQGDTAFVHDAIDGNIGASFVRRMQGLDRRLASLGRSFSEADVASFSLEWTPRSSGWFPWPSLGFFDTASNQHVAGIKIRSYPASETGGSGQEWAWLLPVVGDPGIPGLRWEFGETYLLEFELNGPAATATASISVWDGFSFVEQITTSMPFPAGSYEFDAVGFGNIQDVSGQGDGNTFVADIDNFAFTPPPVPCDWDANSDVGILDLLAFLSDWFAGSLDANYNGDNFLNVDDLLDFLSCWFPATE